MPDLITGVVAGWFANRIFGPSVDAMGKSLSAHLQSRLPAIFGRSEQIAKELNIEPGSIKPGLLTRMIIDASFSEETDEITDWWANLFLSASVQGDNKHAVFSDMMAMIGPSEAACLSDFLKPYEKGEYSRLLFGALSIGNVDVGREAWILDRLGNSAFDRIKVDQMVRSLEEGELEWPIRLRAWKLYIRQTSKTNAIEMQSNGWYEENELAIEILVRTGVLRLARVDVPAMGQPSWVDTVELTRLGAEFYLECTGAERKWSKLLNSDA